MSTTFAVTRCAGAAAPDGGRRVARVQASIELSAGTLLPEGPAWQEEPLEKGAKLVLIQSGHLRCCVPGQPEQRMRGPYLCLIASDGESATRQMYGCDEPLRYTIVRLGPEMLDPDGGLLPAGLRPRTGAALLRGCPANRALQALAAQIATCAFEGGARSLYLGGKALELAALGAQLLGAEGGGGPAVPRATAGDVERVHAARDILYACMQDPPTLEALAVRVGTNPRKLTAGFRQVFGTSVFALLAELRLARAHAMLCDDDASVSTVAYRVGYSPAHFAVAFRKRYGVSPSEMRAAGAPLSS